MTRLLVTRPRHEITTNYLYYFAGEVIVHAKNSTEICDLRGSRANRKEFEGVVIKTNPDLLFLNGHGNSETVTGNDNEPILIADENDNLTKGKIVYALSCSSASRLGKTCVEKGARAYIGYSDDFIFVYEEDKISKPLNDAIARQFLEPSNLLMLSLIKGNSAGSSIQKSKSCFATNIKKLLTSTSPQIDKTYIPWLIWDMDCQVCVGDENAKI
jgi:hypothetical protein